MTKYNLEIRPAVPIELRHQIGELIEQHGYNVYAQGQFMNGSICDIQFDEVVKDPKTHCSICNAPQFDSSSGITCKNGHGGADSIEDQ